MSRRLIVNADDFGLSAGINRGILEAFRGGILTSTTMLANLDGFDDAASIARDHPDLPVGVHLSLLWGRPVSDPRDVPSLVDRRGAFPRSLAVVARRYALGRLRPADVRRELAAQVRRVLDAGVRPTHFDTHKHVHCLPGVLDAVIAVSRELGVGRLRLPIETPLRPDPEVERPAALAVAKRKLIRGLFRGARAKLRAAGLETTDHFVGIDGQSRLDAAALLGILRRLPEGTTELMCHPGRMDDAARRLSRTPPLRELELRGLCDPAVKDYVGRESIELIDYGKL